MTKYNVQFSNEAKNDFIDIIKYIKYNLQENNLATKLSLKIRENIKLISINPEIHSVIDDEFIKKLELRKSRVDNYLIFYRIIESEKTIQIVRIMYGRRNWNNILDT